MSEDDTGDRNEQPHFHAIGFGVPIPSPEMLDPARRQIATAAMDAKMWNFLDSLTVDQLLGLRYLLNFDQESRWNNYWDGQIVSILRIVHKVSPESGKSLEDLLREKGEAQGGDG